MSPEVSIEPRGLARCQVSSQLLSDLILPEATDGEGDGIADGGPERCCQLLDFLVGVDANALPERSAWLFPG